jgi:ComF family protein
MHQLKYKKDVAMGDVLALPLIDLLRGLDWPVDLITPVPLSRQRMRERGYNQAGLLARPVALALDIAYRPQALVRARDTESQVGMNARQRRANLQGAFVATEKLARGKRVLVIDDVTTTGATIEACSLALANAGCAEVYGLTLARAVKQSG